MAEAVLFVTRKGYGKVVENPREAFPPKNRGGQGVSGYKLGEDDDAIVCAEHVQTGAEQNVLITTAKGKCLMTPVDGISVRSRSAGGVRIMNVADDDEVASVLV